MDSADHGLECRLPEWYEQFMGTHLAFGGPWSVQKADRDLMDCLLNPRRRQRKGQTPVPAEQQRFPTAAGPQRFPAPAGPPRFPRSR
ncbi:hypothetical protein VZT92_002002 [Zoarces viviparus]|uniref:Uncharacterized protein n=1 Tax=Zoarces viviparus TaxID=48416 RepID=A0AAW1G6S6_ZOAVI